MGKKTNRHGLIWKAVERIQCAPDEKIRRDKPGRILENEHDHRDILNAFRL